MAHVARGRCGSCGFCHGCGALFAPEVAARVAAVAPLHGWSRRTPDRRGPRTAGCSPRVVVACACWSYRGALGTRALPRRAHGGVIPQRRARHCMVAIVTWPRGAWRGASSKQAPAGRAHCGIIPQNRVPHRIVAIGRGYERLVWPRAVPKVGKVGPNPAVNRTRRFIASTWPVSARRAGYLDRWAPWFAIPMNKCRRPRKAGAIAVGRGWCDRERWPVLCEVTAEHGASAMGGALFAGNAAARGAQVASLHGGSRRTPDRRGPRTDAFSRWAAVVCACWFCRGASGAHALPRRAHGGGTRQCCARHHMVANRNVAGRGVVRCFGQARTGGSCAWRRYLAMSRAERRDDDSSRSQRACLVGGCAQGWEGGAQPGVRADAPVQRFYLANVSAARRLPCALG